MKRQLAFTLCRTRQNGHLVTLDSSLGDGMEATPGGLRALADALLKIADESEAHNSDAGDRKAEIEINVLQ